MSELVVVSNSFYYRYDNKDGMCCVIYSYPLMGLLNVTRMDILLFTMYAKTVMWRY